MVETCGATRLDGGDRGIEMQRGDVLVADDRQLRARAQLRDPLAERRELAAADHDVVAALAERDVDDDRIARSQRRGHDAVSPFVASAGRRAARQRPGAQHRDDLVDDLVVRHLARLHGEVGELIDRIAHVDELPQGRGRIVGVQQRAVVAALDPAHQHVELGLEPDRHAFAADRGAGVGIHEGAAAGRQHLRPAVQQARDHARLAGTEVGLAVGREDIGDRHAGGLLDLGIGIHERQLPAASPAAARSRTCRRPSCRRAPPSARQAPPRWRSSAALPLEWCATGCGAAGFDAAGLGATGLPWGSNPAVASQ